MTSSQAQEVAMAIWQNEDRSPAELTNVEIFGYLVERGIDDTDANVDAVRKA
tara:strand:- start:1449 stop:1604 length:156 start_codon:yes stop_codon:yes gene_type:complete